MDLTTVLSTYPGVQVVQVFFHSLIAAVVAGRSVAAWDIQEPGVRQRFYLLAVILPLVCLPLYQWFDPTRGSIHFRLQALLDSSRWTSLELWGVLPVSLLLLLLLAATTALFLVQEAIPILRHRNGPGETSDATERASAESPAGKAAAGLADQLPDIFVIEDEDPVIFSVTRRPAAVYVSSGLIATLHPDELRSALAHEVAHILRARRPLLVFAYLARVLLFFSPGTMFAFRRAVAEEEKLCDDWAAAVTGRPEALATVLEKLRDGRPDGEDGEDGERDFGETIKSLEKASYDLMVQERIRRLTSSAGQGSGGGNWIKFGLTAAAMITINYFVV